MAIVRGLLGQSAPAATTDTLLYTVPSSKEVVAKVIVANRSSAAVFRVWLRENGAATSNEQYIAYDVPLAANDSVSTVTFMLGDNDEVYVRADTANVSFNCVGIELDEA